MTKRNQVCGPGPLASYLITFVIISLELPITDWYESLV